MLQDYSYPQILGAKSERQKHLERLYSPVLAGSPANRRGVFRTGGEGKPTRDSTSAEVPRSSPRIQRDDHVPNVRDGNEIEEDRKRSSRPVREEKKI